jgi:hypothetical protein
VGRKYLKTGNADAELYEHTHRGQHRPQHAVGD